MRDPDFPFRVNIFEKICLVWARQGFNRRSKLLITEYKQEVVSGNKKDWIAESLVDFRGRESFRRIISLETKGYKKDGLLLRIYYEA